MSSVNSAEIFCQNKEAKKQEKLLKKALKFSPDDSLVISNCGDFYFENERYK